MVKSLDKDNVSRVPCKILKLFFMFLKFWDLENIEDADTVGGCILEIVNYRLENDITDKSIKGIIEYIISFFEVYIHTACIWQAS